jgi:hypothetical protein
LGQADGDGPAETSAATGDQRFLTCEIEQG